jgi:hypothetical protein
VVPTIHVTWCWLAARIAHVPCITTTSTTYRLKVLLYRLDIQPHTTSNDTALLLLPYLMDIWCAALSQAGFVAFFSILLGRVGSPSRCRSSSVCHFCYINPPISFPLLLSFKSFRPSK